MASEVPKFCLEQASHRVQGQSGIVLTRLAIGNLATISEVDIEFEPGFTVLTGETGAGKSILIDAIRLVLGGKASADLIRTGATQITVEAAFDIGGHPQIRSALNELEIPGGDELILRRIVQTSGRSRILANGCQITVARLEGIAPYLINIHGQHDNQILLHDGTHLDFLDGFADLTGVRDKFGKTFRQYSATLRERDELRDAAEQKNLLIQDLRQQVDDIRAGNLDPEEETALQRELIQLTHAEQLLSLTGAVGAGNTYILNVDHQPQRPV